MKMEPIATYRPGISPAEVLVYDEEYGWSVVEWTWDEGHEDTVAEWSTEWFKIHGQFYRKEYSDGPWMQKPLYWCALPDPKTLG